MNPIGIMQGRLSPPIGERIQSFPLHCWREEFGLARAVGLDCIEWIYDENESNPIRTDAGIAEVHRLAADSGITVSSICADYYMHSRLVAPGGALQTKAVEHAVWLIGQAGALGARYIILPFVDESSLRSPLEVEGLSAVLRRLLPAAERSTVEIHLETDIQPEKLAALIESFNHPLLRANLDMGNSAALGHKPTQELTLLGPCLGSVHVKDRLLGGGTVPLGTGAADLPSYFRLTLAAGFDGPFILQAARVPGLSETDLAASNRMFVERHIAMSAAGKR